MTGVEVLGRSGCASSSGVEPRCGAQQRVVGAVYGAQAAIVGAGGNFCGVLMWCCQGCKAAGCVCCRVCAVGCQAGRQRCEGPGMRVFVQGMKV